MKYNKFIKKHISIILLMVTICCCLFACKEIEPSEDDSNNFITPEDKGVFISIEDSYTQKLINDEDVKTIAYYYGETTELDFTPTITISEGISQDTISDIRNSKAYWYNKTISSDIDKLEASDVEVTYLGTYSNYEAVALQIEGIEASGVVVEENVGEYTIHHDSTIDLTLWKSNSKGRIDTRNGASYTDLQSGMSCYIISEKTHINNNEGLVVKYVFDAYLSEQALQTNKSELIINQATYEKDSFENTIRVNKPSSVFKELNTNFLEEYVIKSTEQNSVVVLYKEYVNLNNDFFDEDEGSICIALVIERETTSRYYRALLHYRKINDEIYFYDNYKDFSNDVRK